MGNNEGNGQNGGPHPYRTFLYIRTHPDDNGAEPLPAGLPFWVSPDIVVIKPSGERGGEAVADSLNHVEVCVTNGGMTAAVNAHVECYVADPCTAFTPATAPCIGNGYLNIPSFGSAPITFPWIPSSAEAGHRCLLARVCLCMPPDCYADGSIFDVRGDRHVAQRNIQITVFHEDALSFGFKVVNPTKTEGEFLVRAGELKIGRKADLVRRTLGSKFAQFAEAPLKEINLAVGDSVMLGDVTEQKSKSKALPVGVLPKAVMLGRGRSNRFRMKREEVRHAILTVSRNSTVRPGDIHIVQVEQLEMQTKQRVGDFWLVVQQ